MRSASPRAQGEEAAVIGVDGVAGLELGMEGAGGGRGAVGVPEQVLDLHQRLHFRD